VLLETPGKKPFRVIADDLESFVSQLTAIAYPS
ncbi:MAG: Syd protein, partial [Pseudomonadota bacterium]